MMTGSIISSSRFITDWCWCSVVFNWNLSKSKSSPHLLRAGNEVWFFTITEMWKCALLKPGYGQDGALSIIVKPQTSRKFVSSFTGDGWMLDVAWQCDNLKTDLNPDCNLTTRLLSHHRLNVEHGARGYIGYSPAFISQWIHRPVWSAVGQGH